MSEIDSGAAHPTRHWRSLDDGRIECTVCPRACRLREGQRGFCFVRAHVGDAIVLESYGRSSGFCVDPIEKKPLYHFLPGSSVLSFGGVGCNLACKHCQNWRISRARRTDALAETASPEEIVRMAKRCECPSVAFTYNDPVVFLEYAADVARACHEHGIRTVAVTAGYVHGEARADLFRHIDAANVDLKSFSDGFYRRICGGRLEPVLDTLRYLRRETAVWLELTTLLIPGENDAPSEIDAMARWIAEEMGPDTPVHFTAFHPDWRMQDRPATPAATLSRARAIALSNGLRYVYTGNTWDAEGGVTRCHACGRIVAARLRCELLSLHLDECGRCVACGAECPGVFGGPPGGWGAHRVRKRVRPE